MRKDWKAKARRAAALMLSAGLLFSGGCSAVRTGAKSATRPVDLQQPFAVRTVLTNEKQGRVRVETAVPVFSGFSSAEELNRKIGKLTDDGVAELKKETADLSPDFSAGADALYYGSFFDYSRNGDLLSVWVTSENYSGGAHGMHWIDAFTVDTKTGKFYTSLSSLFRSPEAGVQTVTDGILRRIKAQPDAYMPSDEQTKTIKDKKGDYKFYLDGGNLVVYFDLYEIVPYAAGIPTFTFPVKDLNLEPKLSPLPALGKARCNGTTVAFSDPVVCDENGVYLPLKDAAAVLGRTVTETGGKYEVSGVKAGVKDVCGTAYAPLTFFTGTLGDFVVYDGEVLRFFRQAGAAGFQDSGALPRVAVALGQY